MVGKSPYSACMLSLSLSLSLWHSWCEAQRGLRDDRNHPAKICANGSSETLSTLPNSRERLRVKGREAEMTGKRREYRLRKGTGKKGTDKKYDITRFLVMVPCTFTN